MVTQGRADLHVSSSSTGLDITNRNRVIILFEARHSSSQENELTIDLGNMLGLFSENDRPKLLAALDNLIK